LNPKDALIFVYGLFMGTSTGYLKPARTHMFPITRQTLDTQLTVQLGGTCNCGVYRAGREVVVINTGRDAGASELRKFVDGYQIENLNRALFLTSEAGDDAGGIDYFKNFERVQRDLRLAGGEIVHLRKYAETTVVLFAQKQVMFTGRLFFNKIHPPMRELGRSVADWLKTLESIIEFEPKIIVPAEGEIGTIEDLRAFQRYLVDLADSNLDLAALREKYGNWVEIIGTSSLPENFEFVRGIVVK
jgi:hypothetical protein